MALDFMTLVSSIRRKNDHAAIELLRRADRARDAKDWAEAARCYAGYLEARPKDAAIWAQLGHAIKESGDLASAERAYRRGLALKPNDADLRLQLGHALKLQERFEEALAAYEKSAEIDGTSDAALEAEALRLRIGAPKLVRHDDAKRGAGEKKKKSASKGDVAARKAILTTADRDRDERKWASAAEGYAAYLASFPDDAKIWAQLGNMLKETGRLAESEQAYRRGLSIDASDGDLHLQLGHVLKLRGRIEDATRAYARSFEARPTWAALAELTALGARPWLDRIASSDRARESVTFVEISDLLRVMRSVGAVSGIQRVQLGLISFILTQPGREFCAWRDNHLWKLEKGTLRAFLDDYRANGTKLDKRGDILNALDSSAVLVSPREGDVVVSTGVIYFRPDVASGNWRLKSAGVKIGAYVHDFIPLTHPEFVTRSGTLEFASSMVESMATIDFALTVSEHVAEELRRLRRESGFPDIPVRAVPNAHRFVGDGEGAAAWTPAISYLEDASFVLCVATAYLHKNHLFLLQVWRLLIDRGVEPPILVCAGKREARGSDFDRQLDASPYLSDYIRFVDAPTDEELRALYGACAFTILPSFVEGWGLPVGESLSAGKLCLASKVASIPEVGGDFVVYIDPYDPRGCADVIQSLLEDDGAKLRRLETRVKDEFRPRGWAQQGSEFLAAVDDLARAAVAAPLASTPFALPLGAFRKTGRVRFPEWPHQRSFGPFKETLRALVGRLVLGEGWAESESWGTWMAGRRATLSFVSAAPPGARVVVAALLRSTPWCRRNEVVLRVGDESRVVETPTDWPRVSYKEFLVALECVVGPTGRVDFSLETRGALQEPWWGTERPTHVGLIGVAHESIDTVLAPVDAFEAHFEQASQRRGSAFVARSGEAFLSAVRRALLLDDGWFGHLEDGARMRGERAALRLPLNAPTGADILVALKFVATNVKRPTTLLCRLADGSSARTTIGSGAASVASVILEGKAVRDGFVEVEIEARPAAGGGLALTYAGAARLDDRAGCAAIGNAVLRDGAGRDEARRGEIAASLRFTIAGHFAGHYSLAAVNRRLAFALEDARPGSVRAIQIESRRTGDLPRVPKRERARLRTLTARQIHEEGLEALICQHWPVLADPPPSDCPIAFFAWEENIVPRAVIETFNRHYVGVLATSEFVVKSLVDSGLTIPVRAVGNCPDVSKLSTLAAGRRNVRPSPQRPFTFLHVSSGFPRKGVDVLLKAYAEAFRRDDPVRLVIKTFANPHNDVARQIAELAASDPTAPPIESIVADYDEERMAALYARADALVLPSRAEGFTLPAVEAFAAGIPVIVTGFGGHMDFVSSANARLVDYDFAYSTSHVASPGAVWAEPCLPDLVDALKETMRDAEAGRSFGERVRHGSEVAARIGDPKIWAKTVVDAVVEILDGEELVAPRVAWVSTWQVTCGVAEYSKMLLDAYPEARQTVEVFCDERTAPDANAGYRLRRAWKIYDEASMETLAAEIRESDADAVVIQHHKGLIRWADLAKLLTHPYLAARTVVVALHNVLELADAPAAERQAALDALSRQARVLVHSVHDLNALRSYGLVANVALFPHGASARSAALRGELREPDDAPLIGCYGFFLPHKGVRQLIRAFASIVEQWPKARLRLVNARHPAQESADEIDYCKKLAVQLGVDQAIQWFNDYLPNEKSLRLLAECDLLALPYQETRESASGALRIAVASLTPTIVTPLPIFDDARDAVGRTRGVEAADIAAAISETLRNRDARLRIRAAAEKWLADNDWAELGPRLRGVVTALTRR